MPVLLGTKYAQPSDLSNLGLMGGSLSNVPLATQDAALLAASAVADSYLQSRYKLPLTQWGQDLVRAVCLIAAYDLLTSRGFGMVQGPDENIRLRYQDALAWLKGIAQESDSPAYVLDSSGATNLPEVEIDSDDIRGWTPRGLLTGCQ